MERIEADNQDCRLANRARHHAPDDPTPLCSVVIPSYNGRHLLSRCLASIERHRPADPALPIEVIVSDDASTDGTAEWLEAAYPEVKLIRAQSNGGFCAAANAGIAAAGGRFIQLLNNDTEVAAGWIEAGIAPFGDPSAGSVAPLVRVRSEPALTDSAGDSYNLAGRPTKRGHGRPAGLFAGRPIEEVFGASGSSAFYRAEVLKRLGGFDPLYGSYYEDVDLAFRLRWAGYRCFFAPTCLVYHDVSASYDHGSPSLQRRMSRNAELLFWSNMPAGALALAVVPHLLFLIVQGLWRAARGRPWPFLRGKIDAAFCWREILVRRRYRGRLAGTAPFRPHFALGPGPTRNNSRRPAQKSAVARTTRSTRRRNCV